MKRYLLVAAAWLIAGWAIAAEPCHTPPACGPEQVCGGPHQCGRCGCDCGCEKHCQLVCETKEIKKTVWVVKCEDFCTSLPGCALRHCEGCDCQPCGPAETCAPPACGCDRHGNNPCAAEENKCYVPPKCGKVRTKKTLEKKEVVCRVPSYKCVVVYCCPNCCGQNCDAQPQTAPPPEKKQLPPAPAPVKTTSTEDAPMPPAFSASRMK
jgi:hypothetical protein